MVEILTGIVCTLSGFVLLVFNLIRKVKQTLAGNPNSKIVYRQIYFIALVSFTLFIFSGPLLLFSMPGLSFFFLSLFCIFAFFYFLWNVAFYIREKKKKFVFYKSPYRVEPLSDSIALFYEPEVSLGFDELNKHVHVLAPSGSGKTKSVLAPMALQVIKKGLGTLIIDPKGDNEVISALLKEMKKDDRLEDFWYFDPIKPHLSNSYNPFYYAVKYGHYKEIAEKIIATLPKGGGTATFYEKLQSEFTRAVSALLSVIPYTNKMVNFIDLYAIIAYLPRSIEYLIDTFEPEKKEKNELVELWIKTISQEARANREYKNYLRNLQQHLALYAFTFHPKLLNDYDPEIKISEGFRQGKLMYFALRSLDFPAGESLDIGKMVFLDLINHVAFKYNNVIKWNVPDLVFVDEAPQVFVPEAVKLFEMARGAGMGVILIHQSIFQFEQIQKGLFQNIFSNCNVKLILGAGDDETAKFYANYLGEEKKLSRNISVGGTNPFRSIVDYIFPHWGEVVQEKYDYRVRPEELKRMEPGTAYLINKKYYGLKGKLYYFADDKPVDPAAYLLKRSKDTWKDGEKGLVLLATFQKIFGQLDNAQKDLQAVKETREKIARSLPIEEIPAYTDSLRETDDIISLLQAVDTVDQDFLPVSS